MKTNVKKNYSFCNHLKKLQLGKQQGMFGCERPLNGTPKSTPQQQLRQQDSRTRKKLKDKTINLPVSKLVKGENQHVVSLPASEVLANQGERQHEITLPVIQLAHSLLESYIILQIIFSFSHSV
jgi:hypothetical protein